MRHPPQGLEAYQKNGWIYSQISHNNFGTNFSVSQTGLVTLRYAITTGSGRIQDGDAMRWGWQTATPWASLFTDRANHCGTLPPCQSFLKADDPGVAVMTWKQAEDGTGYCVRLWNGGSQDAQVRLTLCGKFMSKCRLVSCTEEELDGRDIGEISIPSGGIRHVRVWF